MSKQYSGEHDKVCLQCNPNLKLDNVCVFCEEPVKDKIRVCLTCLGKAYGILKTENSNATTR